jgi:hypothetical protein
MTDAQRYRKNGADCILAAERSGPAYRDLTFAIAESWLSLTAQQGPWTNFPQFGAKHRPPRLLRPYGCLSNILANQVAVGSPRCKRGKQFPPNGSSPDGLLIGSVAERSAGRNRSDS